MIDYDALLKISYGVYAVCSGNSKKGNGFISNSIMQITSDPVQVAVTCNKKNYSAEIIADSGMLAISVLPQNVSSDVISIFGYKSGREIDKLKRFNVRYGINDVPVLLSDAIATLECKVKETIDAGTHLIFLCEVLEANLLDSESDPITYDYYRKVKKGVSPANAPTYINPLKKQKTMEPTKYRCPICGYEYDDSEHDIPFEALDDDWGCPVCGATKDMFEKI